MGTPCCGTVSRSKQPQGCSQPFLVGQATARTWGQIPDKNMGLRTGSRCPYSTPSLTQLLGLQEWPLLQSSPARGT